MDKLTPDYTRIVSVYVDYRKECQFMNRAEDEIGNIWFLTDIDKREVVE